MKKCQTQKKNLLRSLAKNVYRKMKLLFFLINLLKMHEKEFFVFNS